MLVAQFLAKNARQESSADLPDPGMLWLKAQFRARDAALAKATRPILIVTRMGVACILLLGIWFVFASPLAHDFTFDSFKAGMLHGTNSYWSLATIGLGIGTAFCALISSALAFRS